MSSSSVTTAGIVDELKILFINNSYRIFPQTSTVNQLFKKFPFDTQIFIIVITVGLCWTVYKDSPRGFITFFFSHVHFYNALVSQLILLHYFSYSEYCKYSIYWFLDTCLSNSNHFMCAHIHTYLGRVWQRYAYSFCWQWEVETRLN
jgi:hypothetical protein